jgi:hypothetical protein
MLVGMSPVSKLLPNRDRKGVSAWLIFYRAQSIVSVFGTLLFGNGALSCLSALDFQADTATHSLALRLPAEVQ